MSSDHPTLTIFRGDSIDSVRDLLQLTVPPQPILVSKPFRKCRGVNGLFQSIETTTNFEP